MNRHNLFTFNFKKKIFFSGKVLLFFSLIVVYLNQIMPQYDGEYNSALSDKVERLETTTGPKIVLIGDSNLSFGINSELIEAEFGMPVVNMGYHGGIGNSFHEEMSKINIQEGDIYILGHSTFADDDTIGDIYAWVSLENHLHLWTTLIRPKDIMPMIRSFPWYLRKCLDLYTSGTGNIDNGGVYSRSAINSYGDVAFLRKGSEYEFQSPINASPINDITVKRINKLNEFIESHGATLLIAGYPIGNGQFTADVNDFIQFQMELESRLDCTVISNYVDYMLDYSYFYNTDLHLNTEGAEIRTRQLISDIRRWLLSGSDAKMGTDIYQDIIADANLSHITDINQYLLSLSKGRERYTIFISAKEILLNELSKEFIEGMNKLGLDISNNANYHTSYLAVIDGGKVSELEDYSLTKTSGITNDGEQQYTLKSSSYGDGSVSSISLNEWDYSKDQNGFNIVVYSNESHRILDSVTLGTSKQGIVLAR